MDRNQLAEMAAVLMGVTDVSARRKSAGFSPQGYTGGPLNMDGYLADGRKASMRSEATDNELARRAMPRPYSMIGSMLNPQSAAVTDAIRENLIARMKATGY